MILNAIVIMLFFCLYFSVEEVSLVQNLVYYVERAYRTPDFGPWGRGVLTYCFQPPLPLYLSFQVILSYFQAQPETYYSFCIFIFYFIDKSISYFIFQINQYLVTYFLVFLELFNSTNQFYHLALLLLFTEFEHYIHFTPRPLVVWSLYVVPLPYRQVINDSLVLDGAVQQMYSSQFRLFPKFSLRKFKSRFLGVQVTLGVRLSQSILNWKIVQN